MRTALALLLLPAAASGQSFDLYGFDAKTIAMAGVQGASDGDFAAVFHNPSLLREARVGLGFHWAKPYVDAEPIGDPGGRELTEQNPPDYSGFTFGAALPIGGVLRQRAALGVGLFVPRVRVFRSRMIDEGTAQFYRYDSAPERIQVLLAASGRPTDWLSLGGGVQLGTDYGGAADFTAVLGTGGPGRVIRRRLDSDLVGLSAPTAGATVGPFGRVRFHAAWRGEVISKYSLPIDVNLGDFGLLNVTVDGTSHFSPHVLVAGASGSFLDDRLTAAVDLGWELWSRTPPLVADITIGLPQTLVDLGFDPSIISRPIEMGFHDVLVPRIGVQWRHTDRLSLRGGYYFRPTPVPDQTGRTNFLDSPAHVASAGVGLALADPLGVARELLLDASLQLALLQPRDVVKVGPNVNPDYRFGGTTLGLATAVSYRF